MKIFNFLKRKQEPEPAQEGGFSICPGEWLKLVHHTIQDPSGAGWLTKLRPDQAPLIRRGAMPLDLTGDEASLVAEMMNKPYSELIFGKPVTPDDLRYALSQNFKTESK